jgi:NADPH-dependent curcumin reductase CurA
MISIDELERIKNSVTKTGEDVYTTMRNAERQTLQETSKNRIKNWPNTMEALRLKREEDRIRRLEDEEVSAKTIYLSIDCETRG